MKNFLEGMVLGIGYFTRIRIPYEVKQMHSEIYRFMVLALPVSGLLLGVLTLLGYQMLAPYANAYFVAFLFSAFYLAGYGFLHLEAVMDIVDATYGGHSGKDRYAILKDPHIGSIGALYTFTLVLVKLAALTLLLHEKAYALVVVMLMLSRLSALWVIQWGTFHKNSAFIAKMQNALKPKDVTIATLLVWALAIYSGVWWLVFLGIGATFWLYRWLQKEFGFVNGDGLGFIIEVVETAGLVLLVFTVT